jgi:DNA repair ATPase RecN
MYTIDELIKDHQLYHSEFQQDYFITMRSGGTQYGQYKQALRELYKRFRGLKGLYAERDLLEVEIDELEEKILNEDEYNKFEQRRNKINFDKKSLDMIEMLKNIDETEREFKRFYQQS